MWVFKPRKPVWLFLAFFLKALRNSVQVAPVGSPQPRPLGGILAPSRNPHPLPAPRLSRERGGGATGSRSHSAEWGLSSRLFAGTQWSGKQPHFDACRLGSSLGHAASLERSLLPPAKWDQFQPPPASLGRAAVAFIKALQTQCSLGQYPPSSALPHPGGGRRKKE